MKKIDEMISELSKISNRHDTFMGIFKAFQQSIKQIQADTFPVKNITLKNISDEKTLVSFIGRTYELTFCSCMVDGSMKGKILASRVLDEDNIIEITNITYNGQSVVDIEAPHGEDPTSLDDDSCCMNLVLNWLSSEINT